LQIHKQYFGLKREHKAAMRPTECHSSHIYGGTRF